MTMQATSKAVNQSLLKRPQPVRAGHELRSLARRCGTGSPNWTPSFIHDRDRKWFQPRR